MPWRSTKALGSGRVGRRRLSERGWRGGMTLIELMVVTVVVALLMTGVTLGLGNLTNQRLKSSAVAIASAVRMAYSRSATTGNTVRIVFDFEGRAFWVEEAEGGRVLLSRNDDDEGEEEAEDGVADEDASDLTPNNALGADVQADALAGMLGADPSQLLSAARGSAESALGDSLDFDMLSQLGQAGSSATAGMDEPPRYRVPRFSAIPGSRGQRRTLEDGVSFALIYTTHRDHPAEDGQPALYFFPGGMTELAVIQLRDEGGYVNSVEVHPLTGRCQIHNVPYEPPMDEDDQNEAREAW